MLPKVPDQVLVRTDIHNLARHPGMPLGVTNHIWTIGELVEAALDGVATSEPKGRKVGRFAVIRGGKA